MRSISPSVSTFHGFRPPASKGASNGRWTGHPTSPSIGNEGSDLRGESTKPGLQRGRMRTAMRIPVPGSNSNSSSASRACPLRHASRVHAGERFGAGTRRPLRSTNRCDRRDIYVPCPGTPRYGIRVPSTPPSSRNLSTACSGRTMSESSQMSKVGISIDRMSSGSWPWTSPPSSSTLAIGVGRSSWFATILACSFRNP
jgi:hypothetical protein